MKKEIVIPLIFIAVFITGLFIFGDKAGSAGKEKWVVAMAFCSDSMIKDAKEEMTAGKSDFDQFCKKVHRVRAVDARCKDGKMEVLCR